MIPGSMCRVLKMANGRLPIFPEDMPGSIAHAFIPDNSIVLIIALNFSMVFIVCANVIGWTYRDCLLETR